MQKPSDARAIGAGCFPGGCVVRDRDRRAIAFSLITTGLLAAGVQLALHNWLSTITVVGAYDIWLLTRPRMIRVIRRLCGQQVDGFSYFQEG